MLYFAGPEDEDVIDQYNVLWFLWVNQIARESTGKAKPHVCTWPARFAIFLCPVFLVAKYVVYFNNEAVAHV